MTTPPSELNRIAVDLDEAELWTLATIVRDYAALIKTYADAVAENARLKAALDRYSEDEMLKGNLHPPTDDGMVRVPVEPTNAMKEAGVKALHGDAVYKNVSTNGCFALEADIKDAYKAMLEAAKGAK